MLYPIHTLEQCVNSAQAERIKYFFLIIFFKREINFYLLFIYVGYHYAYKRPPWCVGRFVICLEVVVCIKLSYISL